MSIYDKASLVLIPSGTKTSKVYSQKPVSGDGDFTFSRSTAATRVNADGNIEKETQNLLLQSNSFDTTWGNVSSTDTGNQADKDGGTDAWKIDMTGPAGRIYQDIAKSGVLTYSVYAKAGSVNFLRILAITSGTNPWAYFNLSTGALSIANSACIDSNIEDIGSGWYRCSITFNDTTSQVRIYPTIDSEDLTGTSGNIYIQDAQLEQGLVARDYIETTTTAVEGGITDNVPRLDYSGGATCPSLLLEPSRTNLVPQSEYFDSYVKSDTSISTNQAQSPEGLVNASLVAETATNSNHYLGLTSGISVISGTTYTFSVFIKKGDGASAPDYCQLTFNFAGFGAIYANFNLNNGTIGTSSGVTPLISDSTINGFWRCSITATATSTANTGAIVAFTNNNDSLGRLPSYLGNTASDFYAYGFQVEQDATYPTSYIPTYGSAVTRNVDSCSKTGVSSLIGQTEGTLFAEVSVDTDSVSPLLNRVISVTDGTLSNRVLIVLNTDETFRFIIIGGGSTLANITTSASALNGFHKVALGYKANDYVAYVDGVQVGSNTTAASVPSSLSQAFLGSVEAGAISSVLEGSVKQSLMFKTRLSNEELADLTTI